MGWPYSSKSKKVLKQCNPTIHIKKTNKSNKSAITQKWEGEAEWLGWLEESMEKV